MTKPTMMKGNASGSGVKEELEATVGSAQMGLVTAGRIPIEQMDVGQQQPVDIGGAYVNGYLYYPYRFKRTLVEDGVELSRYETRVLRSDGVSLGYSYKPAPKGTPQEDRVLALEDGTDITKVPVASTTRQSFSLAGIERFMAARQRGESAVSHSLGELVTRLERQLKQATRLPFEEDYTLLALCVLASYCQRVFEAVPIVLLNGPPGSGKSQLAAAMAELGCNGVVLSGQTSAATLAREIDRTGGLVVLDDLEQVGARGGKRTYSELAQLLKVGYKQATSKKVLTRLGRNGARPEELDLFGLKVVTNTTGADDVLGSRMLVVPTARVRLDGGLERVSVDPEVGEVQALRDDLHGFTLENVASIRVAYRQAVSSVSTRLDEIAAPLLALTDVLADSASGFASRLRVSLDRQGREETLPADPVARVRLALGTIRAQGFTYSFCLIHLRLELALMDRVHAQVRDVGLKRPNGKWVGRLLHEQGWVDPMVKSPRPRLLGLQTHVYVFSKALGSNDSEPPAPLSFCLTSRCDTCRYLAVCPLSAKKLERG